jgi:putative ABC transport system permease protein
MKISFWKHIPWQILNDRILNTRFFRHVLHVDEELLNIGIQGIAEHKLRSFLTMLGIIFGVAAVIAMLAIGEGARRQSLAQIETLGLNNIIVRSNPQNSDNNGDMLLGTLRFTDMKAILDILPSVDAVAPLIESDQEAIYQTRSKEIKLSGTDASFFEMMNLQLDNGALFTNSENTNYQRVCVLGEEAARDLFLAENPLGKKIRIGTVWFTVIGVLRHHPVSTAGATEVNFNDHIFAPLNTVFIRFDRPTRQSELGQLIVHVKDEKQILKTAQLIETILLRRHDAQKDFAMIVPEQLLKQSEETQRIFNLVMGTIAGISLLVGGIGIMNIMLASVLERTREIGIRRSLGATRRDIMGQFLLEAVLLSLIGGIAGILLGYILSYGVTLFSNWETSVSWWSVILAVGVSSGVGILFGYVPARKAAELNPIDALRYE